MPCSPYPFEDVQGSRLKVQGYKMKVENLFKGPLCRYIEPRTPPAASPEDRH
jgi:hypothetical protein